MTDQKIKANRRIMLLLAVTFIVPVVLAKFALEGDWFNRAATNKGTLMQPALDFSLLYPERDKKWYISFITDKPCDSQCELALYSLNQVWVALGKEQDRVNTAVIVSDNEQAEVVKQSEFAHHLTISQVDKATMEQVFQKEPINGLFIVDALGNIILRYPLNEEKQQAVLKSRDILADMRKLLKLSRIG
ncbi:hypothetical protein KIH87_00390 [Paraneptunicella aestuarii]|uniref:hypothetical protein n=1 Tax=Paraneptunicella aestuarii TaxID=2831148 RepID=UPI001E41105E|nr:hypothetical protein [Paraneptunicella aestuarii]UAA38871.1 hypothetical protein KIH87_00390 [Paraneptunicella aestuarii]